MSGSSGPEAASVPSPEFMEFTEFTKIMAHFKHRFPEDSRVFAGLVIRAHEEGEQSGVRNC